VITLILGFFAFSLGTMLIGISNIPFDWITFSFFLFNCVSMGLCSIFWQAPLVLQQIFLVLMSSMMAFSLSNLPSLVTWILLSFLAVWDLIAVLCPYGPLRIMIESAQQNNIELPSALIYTTAISFMADIDRDESTVDQASHSLARLVERNIQDPQNRSDPLYSVTASPTYRREEEIEMQPLSSGGANQEPRSDERRSTGQRRSEGNGLKLGLGDFVFYSVLVGRASLNDWLTTIGCMLSVLSGLVITILILVLKRKPLPALPISIFFGILVYFMVSLTLTTMIQSLTTGPFQVASGSLRAGIVGVGFVFI
jgi:presenilin 1